MSEYSDDLNQAQISVLPNELLLHIFKCLPARDLIVARQVCKRWNEISRCLSAEDDRWEQFCNTDFKSIWKDAKRKSMHCESYYDIYRLLTLWGRLAQATETYDEFCHTSGVADEISNVFFQENGIVTVHKRSYLGFYDINTLRDETSMELIAGDFALYTDCGDVAVVLTYRLTLQVLPHHQLYRYVLIEPQFRGVKYFLVVKRDLYLLNFDNSIHKCTLDDQTNVMQLGSPTPECIVTLSHCDGHLHYVTVNQDVFVYRNNEFVKLFSLSSHRNIFDCIWRYKFYESLDWILFYTWVMQLRIHIPKGPLQHIRFMKQYGDVFFIGCNLSLFLIYYKPFTNGELDLINHQPVKEYNFAERIDIPVLSIQPIVTVDVIEIKDGHKVLVATPKKIIVITYTHEIGKKCKAVVPYVEPGPLAVVNKFD